MATKKPKKEKPVIEIESTPKVEILNPAEKLEEIKEEEKQDIRVIGNVIESREVAPADVFGKLTRNQIELMKRTIAKDATDDELNMFLQVCKGAQLNPFLRQVFMVKRWDSKAGKEYGVIQVGIDGFRSIAEGSGSYAGNDDPVFGQEHVVEVHDRKTKAVTKTFNAPTMATVTVYKVIGGQRFPFTATARWSEYYPGDAIGFQWWVRPYLMLGKCAEALALRKAFPKLLSGFYEESELQHTSQESRPTPKLAADPDSVFKSIAELIQKATKEQLIDFQSKISAPGEKKYTEAQRKELLSMIDKKLSLDGIPVIQQEEQ